jgi:hypothetical protein
VTLAWQRAGRDSITAGEYTINHARESGRFLAWYGHTTRDRVSALLDGFNTLDAAKAACQRHSDDAQGRTPP